MKTTISFGKIDYLENGRKNCPVTVDIELKEKNGVMEFTASGVIWNHIKSDCYVAGQCFDTIAEYVKSPLFKEIYEYWKAYHLNTMNAGTKEQTEAINNWLKNSGQRYDYTKACEYLKEINLYEVEHNGQPYKYGHGWIALEIPREIIERITEIIYKFSH